MTNTTMSRSSKAKKRPTIRDVAALAGVSKSLVSLVYSSPEVVSEHRKARVLEAATKLGFSPNFLARSLAADSGTFVGILVADLHNPLFAEIVDHVRAELEARGQYGFMTSAMLPDAQGNQVLDRRTVNALIDLRPKSVLVVGSIPTIHELSALPENVQIVVASAIPKGLNRASTVRADDALGMRLVIEHLFNNGHTRIAHISAKEGNVSIARREAYVNAMIEFGLAKYISIEECDTHYERSGFEAATKLIESKSAPTAITAYNDLLAIGVQEAVLGSTNKSIAVVGYDNTFLSNLKQISLSSVDPGNMAIAQKAAQLLTQENLSTPKLGTTHLLEPRLIVRNSSKAKLKVK
jgi:DNA-binding LacI/PurR family transcriptional regulator